MRSMKMLERIEIKWDDALDTDGWNFLDEFDFKAHEEDMRHSTIGYFLKKTENALFICQTCEVNLREKPCVHGIFSIPFHCIVSVRKI